MNYDTTAWCFDCRRPRPVDEMSFISPNRHRKVCAECRDRIREKRREAIKNRKERDEVSA